MVTGKYQNRYWENFYKKDNLTTNPSDFCKYVCENYDLKDKNVLEACSGNGRDSYYLSNFCKQITAVDRCNINWGPLERSLVCNQYPASRAISIIASKQQRHSATDGMAFDGASDWQRTSHVL